MSIKIMTLVWDMPNNGIISRTDRDVLLKLADNCNDNGECFPSVANIAAKTWAGRATVFRSLGHLEDVGLIKRTKTKDQKTNHYKLNVEVIKSWPRGSQDETSLTVRPSQGDTSGGLRVRRGGSQDETLNHHITTSTNHQERKNTKKKDAEIDRPDDVDESVWEDFLAHRKTKKSAVTATVVNTIRKQADKAGWSMDDALAEICSRGWTGFRADWVNKQTKGSNNAKTWGTGNGAKVIDSEGNVVDEAETHDGYNPGLSDYERKMLNVRRNLGLEPGI